MVTTKLRSQNQKVFIVEFTDLTYESAKILCEVCEKTLFENKGDYHRHVNFAKHVNSKEIERIMLDIRTTFIAFLK